MNEPQCYRSPEGPIRDVAPERLLPKVGQVISWSTLGGQHYRGRVVEMDSNVAIVRLPDGTRKAVEC